MIYLELIFAYMQIGVFSIGGGISSLPIIQSIAVDSYGWLTMSELTDLITIAEMTPGPFAINSAVFVGIKVAGILGAVCATIGFLIPTVTIVLIFGALYYRFNKLTYVNSLLGGLRPGITALIASAGATMMFTAIFGHEITTALKSLNFSNLGFTINISSLIIFVGTLVLLFVRKKTNPITIILGSGVIGIISYFIFPS